MKNVTVAFGSQKMKLNGLIAQERQTNNFFCVCFCSFIYAGFSKNL